MLATLRDPKLAVEFRISGTQAMSGTTLTSSGSLIVAGPDIELALVTDELNLRVGEVAKGGKVWLRVGNGRWLLDESPTRPPAVASAFAKAVAVEASGSVLLDAVKLDRVHLSGVDLDALLMAMGMADPGTTGSTGDAYLLLAQDGSFAGIQLDVSYAAAAGQERQTIWRTLAVVRLAQVGQTGSPTVATPQDAWIRHYSKRLAYLVNYPPTMRQSEPAEGDSYKGPSSAQCLITGSVIGSKDTLASITKAEVARLTKGGITVAANRAAKVAGDPAQRLELKFQSAGKAYWAVKYIVVHQNVVYTLSWMDLAGRRTALEKVATEMLASFQPVF
ncbi:MAG TPA: hypothetical protein VIR16_06160 [Candidatus Limnocylindrales bacterium]